MNSSDSDSDGDRITDWPYRCTCKCGATDCSDDSDTDNEDTASEESYSDESSSEESTDNKKTIFISIFDHKTKKYRNLISDAVEIQNYREKYEKLPLKNTNNIKKIWADVKVDMPLFGQVPLKHIDNELTEGKKDKDSNKKKFKKPTHLMQKNLSADSRANNSEQSDVANKSNKIVHPIVKQGHGKSPQAQINKENNKETKIKEENKLILKVTVKNITSNEDKNPKNEPNISDKLSQSVKPPITKDNLKSNTGKTVNSNTNAFTSIQPITENNSTKNISNTSNKKSTNENNSVKAHLIKTPVKAVAENKIKKNEENKKKTTVASRFLKEESKEEIKTAKINTENKIEKTNLVEPNVKSNTENEIQKDESIDSNVESDEEDQNLNNIAEKEIKANVKSNTEDEIEKDESIDSNVESDEEDQTLNNNLNKKLKLEVIKFKIPNSDKILPSSNKNKKENSANDKNLQSNKKLSKKQKKKIRQKERKLRADSGKISTSSSRDLSVSSFKSFDDKKSKNNSNKNVKEEAARPTKEKVNKADKNKTENTKLVESGHSKQDTEESEIEEMNSSNDDLDLLMDTEHMPTFIADIIKRKEKNKQAKMKPVTETQTKNNNKKTNEQEKIKIENEQEFTVHMKKRKHVPFSDNKKDYIIYSDRYAEEGVEMILENNLMGALECITVAIDYNQSDFRHYLNRCYCYLRMKKPAYALADAQYVIHLCTNIGQIFIANLRAGQAAYALQNYKQAEYFLKEATRINPENHHAQRELLRVKISHIMSLGFNEKDALIALQKYPSILEAIDYLNKSQKNSSISKFNNNFDIHDYNCDDMVFSSDDEEESENFETMNRMLNYQPGKVKIQHLVAKPVKSEFLLGSSNCDKNGKPKINPDAKKKIVPTNKSANDKAIWVGNLTNNITEQMLKNKFKQFGTVISVYRPCNEAYAFINFEKSEDVTNALINASAHEIAGVKLAVRSAVRQK